MLNIRTISFVAAAVIVAALEVLDANNGSLLFCMLFFVLVATGPIAIVAAADLSSAGWIKPYKKVMFSGRHMILFVAVLFAIFAATGKVEHLYHNWVEAHYNMWLQESFFIFRNIALLLVSWVIANKFVNESLKESKSKVMWGLFWLFAYVITLSIVAFDWIMSLEYPWISTLFGAYFFVEAFYSGLAFAAILTFFKYQTFLDEDQEGIFKKRQMDMMTMFFGFSIFWAYIFFSQYLVIWYGNLPEEVAFFTTRLTEFGWVLYLVPFMLFFVPFWILLYRKMKINPKIVMGVGFWVWAGLLLERVIFLLPRMYLNPVTTALEFVVIGIVFIVILRYQNDEGLVSEGNVAA